MTDRVCGVNPSGRVRVCLHSHAHLRWCRQSSEVGEVGAVLCSRVCSRKQAAVKSIVVWFAAPRERLEHMTLFAEAVCRAAATHRSRVLKPR